TNKEAAEIIDSMIEAIRANPNQFQIEVNVSGQSINVSGGIGLNISATGGGPGSTTIGQNISLDDTQIEIAQKAGINAMNQQIKALIESLNAISRELKSQTPNKQGISKIYQSLTNTWVPQLITSVLGSILARSIGT
ncbi:MAG: hypothetical protein MUO17_04860, partial [Dehalococcoidales bacterium]|nr:hypothetical protein [Dehalococcoidales bacterium]